MVALELKVRMEQFRMAVKRNILIDPAATLGSQLQLILSQTTFCVEVTTSPSILCKPCLCYTAKSERS